jgi:hypothetical protein
LTKQFDEHPEHQEDDKCMILLQGSESGGIVLHGYEDISDAIYAMFTHLRALVRSQGSDLELIAIPGDVSEL